MTARRARAVKAMKAESAEWDRVLADKHEALERMAKKAREDVRMGRVRPICCQTTTSGAGWQDYSVACQGLP